MVGSGDDPNKRLAMYWSDGDMTAQPPGVTNLEYAYPSVEAQQADPDSLLNYCRAVTNARRQVPAIARGTNEFVDVAGEVCLMRRTWEGESVLIALNFSAKDAKRCDLPSPAAVLFDLETGGETAVLDGTALTLPPYAIVILREGQADGEGEENEYYVRRVDGLPEDFFMGMDVSSVLALEKSGVVYRDADGNERDLFELLAENGVNLIRVRVWNDPFDSQGRGYGGGNCDIKAAVEIGKRATAAGMRLLVDFHYSDFWADPSKQMIPKAWVNVSSRQKASVVREWTEECLHQLKNAGVDVAMVQLGNETNGRLCGEASWTNIVKVMRAGGQAVREIFPDALIAVHFANPENASNYRTWAQKLSDLQLDYDVFGTSYYPWWHGTLDNLKSILAEIGQTYGKRVMVLETSYAWTLEDGDFSGNTISAGGFYEKPYPIGVQGQINQVADVIAAMRDIGGIGVCYWEGAWVPVGRSSWAENAAKWEAYGSGWASSFAGEYDPEDAGKYYGGSACDNQTMFDFDGRALPSLAVFRLVRTGQNAPLRVDALDDVVVECDLNGAIVLPQNVYAVMNDNSRRAVPVAWESIDEAALRAAGPGQYEVHGEAGGRDATLLLRLVRFNFLRNGGFEEDDLSMWRCVNKGSTSQLYCEEKKTDSLSGLRHWHFYDEAASSVCFELEQDAANLPAGRYDFAISVMGGDAGDQEIYSYVKINGETRYTQPTQITSWSNWFTPEIEGIAVETGDTVTVGIHVRCDGAGAWGKIDDAALTSAGD